MQKIDGLSEDLGKITALLSIVTQYNSELNVNSDMYRLEHKSVIGTMNQEADSYLCK